MGCKRYGTPPRFAPARQVVGKATKYKNDLVGDGQLMFLLRGDLDRLSSFSRQALLTVFTIGGGTAGAISCISAIGNAGSRRDTIAIVFVLALYVVGVVSGLLLTKSGSTFHPAVRAFLLVQVPFFSSSLASFHFSALASYVVSLDPHRLSLEFHWLLGSDWEISLFKEPTSFTLGINVVPILLLALVKDH
jgi:hypothetical protein